jgi:hypothetical protein
MTWSNYRASLDAGSAFCYLSGVTGPARVNEGGTAKVSGLHAIQRCFLLGYTACLLFLCSCASLPETPKGSARILPAETPLNSEAGHFGLIVLPITLASGEPISFVVDTGAPGTLLDASLEPKLGKSLIPYWARSSYGVLRGHIHRAPTLSLNGTQLQTGGWIATADLSRLSEDHNRITHSQRRIMGVLGMDCLRHYCIQLDFTNHRMRFLDSGHLNTDSLGKPFPLTLSWGNAVYVNQNLLGKAEKTRVDTGANFDGELTTKAFRQWSGSKGPLVEEHGGGCFAGDPYTNLCIIGDANFNLIGLRFLARHLVTFDFPSRMMYLNRMPTQAPAGGNNGQVQLQ